MKSRFNDYFHIISGNLYVPTYKKTKDIYVYGNATRDNVIETTSLDKVEKEERCHGRWVKRGLGRKGATS